MSMIERAARATFDAVQADGAGFSEPWDAPGMARVRETHRIAVIAMLTAIREPSSSMTHAAQSESHVGGDCEVDYHGIWASMIDAALEEE